MRIRLILVFITLICPLISIADNVKDAYLFQKVDYQQGLSNSAVLCLFQDNEGLMWFGTYDGVLLRWEKYGSVSFRLFGTKDAEQ
jgi:ligand-binding sensor domain-containing protein